MRGTGGNYISPTPNAWDYKNMEFPKGKGAGGFMSKDQVNEWKALKAPKEKAIRRRRRKGRRLRDD